jgi:hypothetical protein
MQSGPVMAAQLKPVGVERCAASARTAEKAQVLVPGNGKTERCHARVGVRGCAIPDPRAPHLSQHRSSITATAGPTQRLGRPHP